MSMKSVEYLCNTCALEDFQCALEIHKAENNGVNRILILSSLKTHLQFETTDSDSKALERDLSLIKTELNDRRFKGFRYDIGSIPEEELINLVRRKISQCGYISVTGMDFNETSALRQCLIELVKQNQDLSALFFLDSVLGPQLVEMTKAIAVSGPAPVRELKITFVDEPGPEELVEEVLDPFKKNCQLYRLLCPQFAKYKCFDEVQAKISRNTWVQNIQWAIRWGHKTKYNRAKLMVVGKGGAGKTSTIRSLLALPFISKYCSTEVADANLEIALMTAMDWKPKDEDPENHLMDSDFRFAVSEVNKKEAVQTAAAEQDVLVPAFNPNVLEALLQPPQQANAKSKRMGRISSLKFFGKRSFFQRLSNNCKSSSAAKTALPISVRKDDRASDKEGMGPFPKFTIWDFGGQEVFHFVHHLFLTRNGLYLIVFNAVSFLDNAGPEIENLKFWTDALRIHAPEAPVALIGTRAGKLAAEQLKAVDKFVTEFCRETGLTFILNNDDDMLFFPVENSLGKKNGQYLAHLKEQLYRELSDEAVSNRVHGLNEQIKMSWMYLMDAFIRQRKTHMLRAEMLAICQRLGFSREELKKMLAFYTEVGTIIYFPKEGMSRSALNEVVVLNPQWLLKALACFLYDPEVHKKKRFRIKQPFKRLLIEYEATGILSQHLLHHLWQSYGPKETEFFESLCLRMLLTSKYSSDKTKFGDSCARLKQYVVPAMLKTFDGDVSTRLPNPKKRFNLYLRFDGPMPTGIFERVVGEFVTKSGEIEGSDTPRLFRNYADVSLGKGWVFLWLNKAEKEILVAVEDHDVRHVRGTTKFTTEVVAGLTEDILGEKFKPRVIVEARNRERAQCEVEKLWRAFSNGADTIQAANVTGTRRTYAIEEFSPFLREDVAGLSAVADNSFPEESGVNYKFNAFLAHDRGNATTNNSTHRKVVDIGEQLRQRDITPWLEPAEFRRVIGNTIFKGEDASNKVVVFLTCRYMKKVNADDGNSKQFISMIEGAHNGIVVVILEECLLDPANWFGAVAEYELYNAVQVDFTTPAKIAENFDELVKVLKKIQRV